MIKIFDLKDLHPLTLEAAKEMQEETTYETEIPDCLAGFSFTDRMNNLNIKLTGGLIGLPGYQLLRYKGNLSYFDQFEITGAKHYYYRKNSFGVEEKSMQESVNDVLAKLSDPAYDVTLTSQLEALKRQSEFVKKLGQVFNLDNSSENMEDSPIIRDIFPTGRSYIGFIIYGDKAIYLDKDVHTMIFNRELEIMRLEYSPKVSSYWNDLYEAYKIDYIPSLVQAQLLLCALSMEEKMKTDRINYEQLNQFFEHCKVMSKTRQLEISSHIK